jgi:hypothetical protein
MRVTRTAKGAVSLTLANREAQALRDALLGGPRQTVRQRTPPCLACGGPVWRSRCRRCRRWLLTCVTCRGQFTSKRRDAQRCSTACRMSASLKNKRGL